MATHGKQDGKVIEKCGFTLEMMVREASEDEVITDGFCSTGKMWLCPVLDMEEIRPGCAITTRNRLWVISGLNRKSQLECEAESEVKE